MREALASVSERLIAHLTGLGTQPASSNQAVSAPNRIGSNESGRPLDQLLDQLFQEILPPGVNTASPGYLGYVPGGGLFYAALGDLITKIVNRHVGHYAMAPGLVQLEWNVIRWLCDIVGFPQTAGGVLTTGGSIGNLSAIVAARARYLPANFLLGTLYVSDQCHHSLRKAARIAGFPDPNIRILPTDDRFRLSLSALREAVLADRANGLHPFFVVGSAGTTNTGAIDDLESLADFCAEMGMWFHVDGAYGAFFILTEEMKSTLAGLSRADSVILDPHKGFGLPYGTGAVLVREQDHLRRAFAHDADYLSLNREEINFCDVSPELSREARGLRLWLPIHMHGMNAFVDHLTEKRALARWAASVLREIPGIILADDPQLSVVAFRLTPPDVDASRADAATRSLLEQINQAGHVFLSSTKLNGQLWVRLCALSFRTHAPQVTTALDEIRSAAASILQSLAA
jgi:aromatic-L-amino-acid decarboxylase